MKGLQDQAPIRCWAFQERAITCGGWSASLQCLALRRRLAVVSGRLDQQPPGVTRPGLRDRSLTGLLVAAVLARHDTEEAHQLRRPRESLPVADLGAQPDRGERVDPAQAAQPADGLRPRRPGHEFADRALQAVAAHDQRVDPAEIVKQREMRSPVAELEAFELLLVTSAPVLAGPIKGDVVAQEQLCSDGGGRASGRRARPRVP